MKMCVGPAYVCEWLLQLHGVTGTKHALRQRSLEKNAGLLTNSEVIEVLRSRGADSDAPSARARPSERMVLRYLEQHSAGALTREQLEAFKEALKPFGLSRTETLQVLNLAPVSAVEVHLIVENAERRLGEERIAELLDVVAAHSPVAVQKRAGSVDDAAAAEADG